jgi:hypothetical protein
MPVSDAALYLYLQWQSPTVDPKNLRTRMSAIRCLHEQLGFAWDPPSERLMVRRCVNGLSICVSLR